MRFHRVWIAGMLVLACGDPSGLERAPHNVSITQDQTWSRADSPHLVRGTVSVSNGATLTIEAGATVLFDSLAMLTLGGRGGTGRWLALGSAAAPITMGNLREDAGPGAWTGIRFRSNTASELHHVNVSGCGGDVKPAANGLRYDSIPPACLSLGNPLLPEERATILIDHVTVEEARGGAVTLWNGSGFADGSSVLSVRNVKGYIARMRTREAARFPLGGTFTGIDTNEVRLAADTLSDSLTLASGVPWAVEDTVRIEGPSEPVLTIPAGATILLSGSFWVGEHVPGGLQIGSDGGPTVSLLPRSTTWEGLEFREYAVRSSVENAVLESCGTEGMPCLSIVGSFTGGPAPAPLLRNVTIRNSVNAGLMMSHGGRPGPGSANVTVTGAKGDAVAVSQSPVGSVPSGQYTGNTYDRIWIYDTDIRQDDTWHQRGVPYYIAGLVSVGDATTRPTLTIEPGVTVISGGVRISVGEATPGAIHAVGTEAEPIVFTGVADRPGSWTGIVVGYRADSSTVFDHVVVDYAGGQYVVEGSFHFYRDLGPIIRNSTIRNSASCGVIIVNQPPWSTDFTAPELGNPFTDNARGSVCGP